ncbi:acidic repeat-containing protein-like, partial [Drosophila obscura]|uniref:acidic repeat-containing protein-like n=1 Tax=Drosophila obscura TaxID=7282 RepID=UPI001BB2CE80
VYSAQTHTLTQPVTGTKARLPATPIEATADIESATATGTKTATATSTVQATTRRRLFKPNIGYEDEKETDAIVSRARELDMLEELENDYLPGTPVYKRLQEVKKDMGIGKNTQVTPKASPILKLLAPQTAPPKAISRKLKELPKRIEGKCSFLKSLGGEVSRECSDKEALFYRENSAKNKEQLAERLYKMFNADVFNNELDVTITWSKRLRNTAGRCLNKRKFCKLAKRISTIELSEEVLTTADRLRCTLIHELCHAATWVLNNEGGHGRVWKNWALCANKKYPELPAITVCHSYSIDYKYTHKCESCNLDYHSRSRKVENLRCRICRGPVVLLLNKKDKFGNTESKPAGEAKGFAKFVKDKFKKYKQANVPHKAVMSLLSAAYAKQKGGEHKKDNENVASIATLTLDD